MTVDHASHSLTGYWKRRKMDLNFGGISGALETMVWETVRFKKLDYKKLLKSRKSDSWRFFCENISSMTTPSRQKKSNL